MEEVVASVSLTLCLSPLAPYMEPCNPLLSMYVCVCVCVGKFRCDCCLRSLPHLVWPFEVLSSLLFPCLEQ